MQAGSPTSHPAAGEVVPLAPGLRRILAPNPGPMTWQGTNTYLLGDTRIAVIDPGPDSDAHLQAILAALTPGQSVSHILVTHAHLDHAPLAGKLQAATGAPILAFGPADAGRSHVMQQLAETGLAGGGEGIDTGFAPDQTLADGAAVHGPDWHLTALHTPGHIGNHLCFLTGDFAFTGDHIMGWASTLVSPPDGDLSDFMASCRRLRAICEKRGIAQLFPGHGDPVSEPIFRINWQLDHRARREAQILEVLKHGPAPIPRITARAYTDIDPRMLPAAERNVLAHLVDLHGQSRVHAAPELSLSAEFSLAADAD